LKQSGDCPENDRLNDTHRSFNRSISIMQQSNKTGTGSIHFPCRANQFTPIVLNYLGNVTVD